MQIIKRNFQTSITSGLEKTRAYYIIASNECWCIPTKHATQYWQIGTDILKDLKHLYRLIYLKIYAEQN